ncbi:two-component response regulator-like APRR2 isoform X2 [Asparagus officinalis]|uniref:two-component response regulator-like APRR2 isoform X2 n=1 Tax=Asparagus officinalis TaxID=4686 RepID=UPI00098E10E0|nr:two-component response regulator-like APRR2 isoform X2 [Asparagus officinalis]
MGCSAEDLVAWRDFPKGLRVLLLDEDATSAAQTKLKLEAMDYIVCSYRNENEALEAISMKAESFHVAIVEVTSSNSQGSFKFIEMAKDLPVIAISDVRCLSTMMKCISLGAAEFLQKPLSEEKLRNIWQHVVHKAFNAGGNDISKSLEPIKDTVVSMLQLQSNTERETSEKDQETKQDSSEESDRFQAPSTPQLVTGGKDDEYFQDPVTHTKDNLDNSTDLIEVRKYSHSKSKPVDITTSSLPNLDSSREDEMISRHIEEEVTSDNGSKTDECSSIKDSCEPSLHMNKGGNMESSVEEHKKKKSFLRSSSTSHSNKGDRRKTKKYRMHKRHILPKDDARWKLHRDSIPRGYMQKPVVVIPPFHSSYGLPSSQVYPFWGHPNYYTPGFPSWHPPQGNWLWKARPGVHADAWGCPVVPPYSQFSMPPQNTTLCNGWDASGGRNSVSKDSCDFNLADEVIDEVVKEAMSKPWLPLPLGLKPPSLDSVLNELQRQGIRTIPPIPRS